MAAIPDDLPLRAYFDYAFKRIRRSSEILATTVEKAAARMKPGSQILVIHGYLWYMAFTGIMNWADGDLSRNERLRLSESWARQVRSSNHSVFRLLSSTLE